MAELNALIADLQATPSVIAAPRRISGRRAGLLAAGAVALLAVGITMFATSRPTPPTQHSVAIQFDINGVPHGHIGITSATPARQLLTTAGLDALIDATRTKLGGTTVDSLYIRSDFASLWKAAPGSVAMSYHYLFDNGSWEASGNGALRVNSAIDVDISQMDVAKIIGLLTSAPQTLGVPDPDPNLGSLTITAADGGRVAVQVANDHGGFGSLMVRLDGTPVPQN